METSVRLREIQRAVLGAARGEVRGLRRALGRGRNQRVVVQRLNDLVYRRLTDRKRRLRQIRFGTFGRRAAEREPLRQARDRKRLGGIRRSARFSAEARKKTALNFKPLRMASSRMRMPSIAQ